MYFFYIKIIKPNYITQPIGYPLSFFWVQVFPCDFNLFFGQIFHMNFQICELQNVQSIFAVLFIYLSHQSDIFFSVIHKLTHRKRPLYPKTRPHIPQYVASLQACNQPLFFHIFGQSRSTTWVGLNPPSLLRWTMTPWPNFFFFWSLGRGDIGHGALPCKFELAPLYAPTS